MGTLEEIQGDRFQSIYILSGGTAHIHKVSAIH